MAETSAPVLNGMRVLIVEDEYVIASDLVRTLEQWGAEIIGPAASVQRALALVDQNSDGRLDGAVLDVNLRGEPVYPVADALAARSIPFVFITGYDASAIPAAYAQVPRCEKPIQRRRLAQLLVNREAVG